MGRGVALNGLSGMAVAARRLGEVTPCEAEHLSFVNVVDVHSHVADQFWP
jgi:hypothetical protein